jgi:hypothetical protein
MFFFNNLFACPNIGTYNACVYPVGRPVHVSNNFPFLLRDLSTNPVEYFVYISHNSREFKHHHHRLSDPEQMCQSGQLNKSGPKRSDQSDHSWFSKTGPISTREHLRIQADRTQGGVQRPIFANGFHRIRKSAFLKICCLTDYPMCPSVTHTRCKSVQQLRRPCQSSTLMQYRPRYHPRNCRNIDQMISYAMSQDGISTFAHSTDKITPGLPVYPQQGV